GRADVDPDRARDHVFPRSSWNPPTPWRVPRRRPFSDPDVTRDVDLDTDAFEHGRLGHQRTAGALGVGCVDDVGVVVVVTGHELVTSDAVQYPVGDGPLRVRGLPAPTGLLFGQLDRRTTEDVRAQGPVVDVDTGEHQPTGLRHTVDGRTPRREEHRVLTPPLGLVPTVQM